MFNSFIVDNHIQFQQCSNSNKHIFQYRSPRRYTNDTSLNNPNLNSVSIQNPRSPSQLRQEEHPQLQLHYLEANSLFFHSHLCMTIYIARALTPVKVEPHS